MNALRDDREQPCSQTGGTDRRSKLGIEKMSDVMGMLRATTGADRSAVRTILSGLFVRQHASSAKRSRRSWHHSDARQLQETLTSRTPSRKRYHSEDARLERAVVRVEFRADRWETRLTELGVGALNASVVGNADGYVMGAADGCLVSYLRMDSLSTMDRSILLASSIS